MAVLWRFGVVLVTVAALTIGAPAVASADIIVDIGVNNQETDNVLLTDATDVTMVVGTINKTTIVEFTSSGGNLSADASGQAVITPGTGNDPFKSISFSLAGSETFTRAVFNLNAAQDGFVTITVTGVNIEGGLFEQIASVDENGQNFFTVTAINGQRIDTLTLLAGFRVEFEDLRQVRIGVQEIGVDDVTPVPEPASMFLVGTGLAGLAVRRLRRKI